MRGGLNKFLFFLLGSVFACLFLETFQLLCSTSRQFMILEPNSVILFSSPSCKYCKESDKLLDNFIKRNSKFSLKHIDLTLNLIDGVANSIVSISKNKKKMREHIFKTQKMWLNEFDVDSSISSLVKMCREIEDVNLEKVYSIVPSLVKETKVALSSFKVRSLPSLVVIEKLEGTKEIEKKLFDMEKIMENNVY